MEHNNVSKLFFSPGSRQQNETNDGVWNNKLKLMMIMLIVLRHIANIYKEGELLEESTCAKNAHVHSDKRKRQYENYLYYFRWISR